MICELKRKQKHLLPVSDKLFDFPKAENNVLCMAVYICVFMYFCVHKNGNGHI